MKIKKLCKSLVLGLVLGTVLILSSTTFASGNDKEILRANPDKVWSGVIKLYYSELSPPPYKFYTNEQGYSGWIAYLSLANETGYANYGGWLYSGNSYPIPSKVIEFLNSLDKMGELDEK